MLRTAERIVVDDVDVAVTREFEFDENAIVTVHEVGDVIAEDVVMEIWLNIFILGTRPGLNNNVSQ